MYKQLSSFDLLFDWVNKTNQNPNCTITPVPIQRIIEIKDCIFQFANEICKTEPYYSQRLLSHKNMLFNNFGNINPFVFGQIFEILIYFDNKRNNSQNDIWHLAHPKIISVSKNRFLDGYYAEAVENAYKEINSRVKNIFHILNPNISQIPDGKDVMNKVFSPNSPMVELADRSTDSGQNIQLGFKEMLSGSMSALRNPAAHENLILQSDDAMRQIIFASMLMYKIDEGLEYTGVNES